MILANNETVINLDAITINEAKTGTKCNKQHSKLRITDLAIKAVKETKNIKLSK